MQNALLRSPTIPPHTLENWCSMMNLLLDYLSISDVGLWRYASSADNQTSCQLKRILHVGHGDCNVTQCHHCVNQVAQQNHSLLIHTTQEGNGIPYTTIGDNVQSYIGVPLIDNQQQLFGVLCVCTQNHRSLTQSHFALLQQFKLTIELQLKQLAQHSPLQPQTAVPDYQQQERGPLTTQTYGHLTRTLNREITKRIKAEKQLYFHKFYDQGTGFFNRTALEKKLTSMADRLKNEPDEIVVIYVGFDNGRNIQHQYGLAFWDSVLRQFKTQTQLTTFPHPIFTGRANTGDLWLVFQSTNTTQDIDNLCSELQRSSQHPITINNHTVYLHINLGVSTSQHNPTPSTMLMQSAVAMMACRDSAQAYCYHSPQLLADVTKTHERENYLLNALRNHALTLYYQPKVDPITRQWIGAEALLRWKHPVLGEISDEALIQLAEQRGLIYELGNFALRQAIQTASQWIKTIPAFKIAVNASVKQLEDPRFFTTVTRLLEEYQLPPQCLEIEMTESGTVTNEPRILHTLTQLHQLGVALSLDDFGTGFASFSYLKKYPFNGIKIDKSFVQSLNHNSHDRDIISATIYIANNMGLTVTVEGIETRDQERFIIEHGGDCGQGYLYGRPMPEQRFKHQLFTQQTTGLTPMLVLPTVAKQQE